jgi:hypothetical protein
MRPIVLRGLFFLFFSIAAFTAYKMSGIQSNRFLYKDGSTFSIMQWELPKDTTAIRQLLQNSTADTLLAVKTHCYWDFGFMTGLFLLLATLCLIARLQVRSRFWRVCLFLLAALQFVALGFDAMEDIQIIHWINYPAQVSLPGYFLTMVKAKFAIGITGFLLSFMVLVIAATRKRKY